MTTLFGTGRTTASGTQSPHICDTTTQSFMQDVIEASKTQPVLVDFWAPWCGPCKQLGPTLEKVVTELNGAVKLAKMNIDEQPAIAQQMGVQSVPTVVAFVDGQPADAFMGAQPESQIRAFIDKIGAGAVDDGAQLQPILDAGEAALGARDYTHAAQAFMAVLQQDPQNVPAIAGIARALVGEGNLDHARDAISRIPEEMRNEPAVLTALAAIDLAEKTAGLGNIGDLAARVEKNPDDHQARFDLALVYNAQGDQEAAIHALVEIVRRDRSWNEDAARKQLLEFFEAWGPKDPKTALGRSKLASVLFS